MKRLVVCCDGTWNNPDQEDNGMPSPTNVFKIFNAIADNDFENDSKQLKYYHPGVGGEGGSINVITGGAVGAGISRHICNAYHWLGKNYEEGDEIYLFGFSRGAFTARSLGAFVGRGLLNLRNLSDSEAWERVHRAYYQGYRSERVRLIDWADYDWSFFHQNDVTENRSTPIHFIGVWDTVGSLGVPDDLEVFNFFDDEDKWRFHDTALGNHVKFARHAMAIDEKRSSFSVTRWSNVKNHPNILECWFPGVHSDVGGGYSECSLANGALLWMIEECERVTGLKFREGIKDTIKENSLGVLHNSYKGMFSKLRSRPRNIPAMVTDNENLFHSSALSRQAASPIAYSPYWQTKMLKEGEAITVEIFASKHWNYTGLYLQKDQKFIFSAQGEWLDANDSCSWMGTEDDKFTVGDVFRGIGTFLGKFESLAEKLTRNELMDIWGTKRVESINWFAMVGAIANDNGVDSKEVVKNDGSPVKHQHLDLTKYQDQNEPFTVTKPGYLYCFPNDVWSLYGNNRGSVSLTITCLA
ncbi:DUF2235 domain-containing protein [Methylicorpusculum oleiharenae]|uniref:DUF2235 domain-containing protein n=1 Tax=Methylicorpusculum oleiharenae TaxID=1338687 RepID=UPI00135CDD8D|nr:DUF2235 domain-containing protein [Methylicorpusculum oleiharenae]MCD2453458.1 DUF2235 domain-containing protein [Methylicorpusculum oleiharenae]